MRRKTGSIEAAQFHSSAMKNYSECISLSDTGTCERFNVLNCQDEICPFKRTLEQEQEQQLCWAERLSSLDELTQKKIAKKYYGGSLPWKNIK